jgi:protein SCO1/2
VVEGRALRRPALIAALCLALGALGGVLTAGLTGPADARVRFTPPAEPPPDFRLRDQDGRWIGPRDARGKVEVLTFLFTSCDDVCPAQAQIIAQAARRAGRRVEVLAVSVDPVGDTPQRVKRFLKRIGVRRVNFHYLLGSRRELAPVWAQYSIAPVSASAKDAEAAAREGIEALAKQQGQATDERAHRVREPPPAALEPYPDTTDQQYRGRPRHDLAQFEHSAYVLLIDKHGKQRAGFPFKQLDASRLEHDMRILLAER